MGMRERAALAIARMDQTRREMGERRSLRQRNTQAIRARTKEALRDRVPGMIEAAKQAAEVAQRREQAGGWATTKTDRDRDFIMGFGPEDESGAGQQGFRPPAAQAPVRAPGRYDPSAPLADEPAEQPPRAAEPPPRPEPPAPPKPARERPRRPERLELDDEDDFSNQSTWMRNQ